MDEERQVILIAEDEEINRAILREMLKDKYDVIEAENGHQAIFHLKAMPEKIALIILDIHMPKLDGYGVMDYLVENGLNEKIPVIITTVDQSSDVLISGKRNKVADIVYKPFRASEIRKRVDNLIEICRYEQDLDSIIEEKAAYLTKQYNAITKFNSIKKISHEDVLKTIAEKMLPESIAHMNRIESYTELICSVLWKRYPQYGLDQHACEVITKASLLHDIGNTVIDDVYVQGEGAAHRAYMQIRKRPIAAAEMINLIYADSELKEEKKYAYDICRCMYEQYDGKGYPEGLAGQEIPISAQIVGLAHRYDELRFNANNEEIEPHKVVVRKMLQSEFRCFNPSLVDIFEDYESEFEVISHGEKIAKI